MARLVVVEGIQGSGKTTTARLAHRILADAGATVGLYCEGDPQPVDLAWQWWLSQVEFESACRRFPAAEPELRRCAFVGHAGVSVAYTKVDPDRCGGQWHHVESLMAGREPFNGALSPEAFMDALAARWSEFGASATAPDAPDVVIFDGAFLQDTLVELVLFGQRDAATITEDLRRLAEAASRWRPLLLRLVPDDPIAAVDAVGRQRVDAAGRAVWREGVEAYMANTPWARARGLPASEAFVAYLQYRQRLEAQILPLLPLEWADVPSPAGTRRSWAPFAAALREALGALT